LSEGASAAPPPSRSALYRRAALLLLFGGVLGIYAQAADFGFIHDDRQLILRQPRPASWTEIAQVFREPHWPGLPYYRPVSRSTMVFQKYLHGDDPAPFHRFNIALMAATALVFFAILRRRPFHVRFVPAWLAAALFAAHPVASHVVYPICSGRETLIPSFLMLCAVAAYLSRGAAAYWTAIAFTALSIFAKEQAAVLPGFFVLADALGLTADPPGRRASQWLRRYAPIALLFAGYFFVRSRLFGEALYHVAVLERPWVPLHTLVYTLQTALVPFVDLVFEPRFQVWWSWPRALLSLTIVAALAWGIVRSGGARVRQALFFAGWWLLALLPTANLLQQEAPFAERYGFLSLAGLVGVGALLASDAWPRRGARVALAAAAGVAIVVLAWISIDRGPHFRDEVAFATEWVRSDPQSYKAQLNRGQGFVETGEWEEATRHLTLAAELRPNSAIIQQGLAYALWRSGDAEAAAKQFERTVRLAPDLGIARRNYGELLLGRGELDAAEEQLAAAARLLPADPRAQLLWGRALRRQGELDGARRQLLHAVRLDPRQISALYELGLLLEARGELEAALARYRSVLALRPEHVRAQRKVARLGGDADED
jgi:tetratricopeptide (TPR) repeat protein